MFLHVAVGCSFSLPVVFSYMNMPRLSHYSDGRLGCFQFVAPTSRVTKNILFLPVKMSMEFRGAHA